MNQKLAMELVAKGKRLAMENIDKHIYLKISDNGYYFDIGANSLCVNAIASFNIMSRGKYNNNLNEQSLKFITINLMENH